MKRILYMTVIPLIVALSFIMFVAGCNTKVNNTNVPIKSKSSADAAKTGTRQLSAAELQNFKPNELGKVLILEYHDVSNKEGRWARYYGSFRSDLDTLYKAGYRPVSLRDFVQNTISIPAGTSPVVITFDDGTEGQFRYLDSPGPKIDPNCAVAILDNFHKKHPDWNNAATFYVYYPVPFRQKQYVEQKLKSLLSMGMDIGNHTYSHVNLKTLSSIEAEKEMALAVKEAKSYVPDAKVDSIALPYGLGPKDRTLLRSGAYNGQTYHNIAALLVGAEPAPSPVSIDFDPYRLPRVQAIQSELDKWLGYFMKHPEKRYVSDGDPGTVTIPKAMEKDINRKSLAGKKLREY